ncbi:reverse transcriptase domain-containing protein [Tanacetum coccineum]
MVPDSEKMMEVFIGGLPRSIEGNVTASKPQTLEEAINIAQRLNSIKLIKPTLCKYQVITNESLTTEELSTTTTTITPTPTTATIITNHNRTEDRKPSGPCTVKCNTCNKVGHLTKNCRNKGPATGSNLLPVTVTCHACGEKGHYANQCRKTTTNNAQGRAYMLRDRNAHQDPNGIHGKCPSNQHLARV